MRVSTEIRVYGLSPDKEAQHMELIGGIVFFTLAIACSSLKFVIEHERIVVYRMGRVLGVKGPGPVLIWPLVDRFMKVDMRLSSVTVPLKLMTADNVPVTMKALCVVQVTDPYLVVTAVENVTDTVEKLIAAALTNGVSQCQSSAVVAALEQLARASLATVDAETSKWGLKVQSLELHGLEFLTKQTPATAISAEPKKGELTGKQNVSAPVVGQDRETEWYQGWKVYKPTAPVAVADAAALLPAQSTTDEAAAVKQLGSEGDGTLASIATGALSEGSPAILAESAEAMSACSAVSLSADTDHSANLQTEQLEAAAANIISSAPITTDVVNGDGQSGDNLQEQSEGSERSKRSGRSSAEMAAWSENSVLEPSELWPVGLVPGQTAAPSGADELSVDASPDQSVSIPDFAIFRINAAGFAGLEAMFEMSSSSGNEEGSGEIGAELEKQPVLTASLTAVITGHSVQKCRKCDDPLQGLLCYQCWELN